MNTQQKKASSLEFRAELLKERIYATLALLAVLLTIDPGHTSPLKAAGIIGGTALSLWAASLIATSMSYRVVMQQVVPERSLRRQLLLHSSLLAAAVFPLLTVGIAMAGFISLELAINVAIGASLLLLLSWSLLSARAMKAGWLATLILAVAELAIGLGVVGLKIAMGH
jgi:hypothetical protein